MKIRSGRDHAKQWINGALGGQEMTLSAVNRCLDDIEKMKHWQGSTVTGIITKITVNNGQTATPLYHVSNGKMGTKKTCTLFFIKDDVFDVANIIGVYQHASSDSYCVVWPTAPEHNSYNLPKLIKL